MELSEVESRLKFVFPARHRQAILDPGDPIHRACDFLIHSGGLRGEIYRVNEWIHGSEFGDPWPDTLIAFASNGCGDYFAYDISQSPANIIYIDPDNSVEENLRAADKLCYETFDDWYKSQTERITCGRCQRHEVEFRVSEDGQFVFRVCSVCGFEERVK